MTYGKRNQYGSVQVRQSRQRHHDQTIATLVVLVLAAGILIGAAILIIVIGALL
jgi:ABC-type lipoprotein release transport system permease subunit